jgi:hypothetical protein
MSKKPLKYLVIKVDVSNMSDSDIQELQQAMEVQAEDCNHMNSPPSDATILQSYVVDLQNTPEKH